MHVKMRHRNNCRLCDAPDVELVVKLEPIPLAEKYSSTRDASKETETFPVDLYMCKKCGHVQCLDVIDSGNLWSDYTYHSGQTKGILDHFESVASKVISTYKPDSGSLVIDVGSNDGSLLRPFKRSGYKVLGIDPATEIARKATESGIETIPELMTIDLAEKVQKKYGAASVITAFNVFAHTDDMAGMAESVRRMLAPNGVFVFEAQYLLDIVDKMLLGTIFHEHMSHHSVKPMIRFLEIHGLELIAVERVSIQKGSIIGYAQIKGGPRSKKASVDELVELETTRKLDKTEVMHAFSGRIKALRSKADELTKVWKQQGRVIAGFGAARMGPTFIAQFGWSKVIQYIFDDHPQKVNKFAPPDGIPVIPSTELYSRRPDFVVILASIHAKKIIESNRKYLEDGGKFVVCTPDMQVVDINTPTDNF